MQTSSQATAPEVLKSAASRLNSFNIHGAVKKLVLDKGFDDMAIKKLSRNDAFGTLVSILVSRAVDANSFPGLDDDALVAVYNHAGGSLASYEPARLSTYRGGHKDNARIDRALSGNEYLRDSDDVFIGTGASNSFRADFPSLGSEILSTPIAIIGYGASGIMTARALRAVGFTKVEVFDKGNPLGIWSQENVYQRSRNNPRELDFLGARLYPAPGNGQEVHSFLEALARQTGFKTQKKIVKELIPSSLNHRLKFEQEEKIFPIVINAMGLGKPSQLSDPERMTTTATARQAGPRWQKTLEKKDVEGKRIVLIGLGNSTAEMLRQIYDFIDDEVAVDFRIVTHYPLDSVTNPDDVVLHRGKNYRVFRDTSRPNLVDFQGDLPENRQDYFRALHDGKIISGARRWEIDNTGYFVAFSERNRIIESFQVDQVFTLTGYKHTASSVGKMGCLWDNENKCVLYDYDGEMIANPNAHDPNTRVYKGYFGIGPILEAPHNPNAIVIPGNIFRIPDLIFGVIMRAAEYQQR